MGTRSLRWTPERVRALDLADPIGHVRRRFVLPPGVTYLDGNSLGALPAGVAGRLATVVTDEWGVGLARNWDDGDWLAAPERVGDRVAPLIGARPGEVLVADSTTICLTKLLLAACRARPARGVILTTTTNFPTDLYAATGVSALLPYTTVRAVPPSALAEALDDSVAVLLLTHVDYRTGAMLDLATTTAAAHAVGALALWDLSHSAGAVAVDCEAGGVDLAVGCGYKYLNGGPGAPAFLYVRNALQEVLDNPLPGWLGHDRPFDFEPGHVPADGRRRFLTSTPGILGISALDAALDAWRGVPLPAVWAKSAALTQLFIEALDERLPGTFTLLTPRRAVLRGAQVSIGHPHARAIMADLSERGVIGDIRPPDVCRFGFPALYVGFSDALHGVEQLVEVVRLRTGRR